MNKALFLDRDGIINFDIGHLCRIEDVEFIPGIFELCRHFQNLSYLIIVVTNQAGIAKGYYGEQDFATLSRWMVEQFQSKGIAIAKFYHCSHHPDFTGLCGCRKPAPGMFLEAKADFDLDMKRSINVGDKKSDIEAGLCAGVARNVLLLSEASERVEDADFSIIDSLDELRAVRC